MEANDNDTVVIEEEQIKKESYSFTQRLIRSQTISCIAGSLVLLCSFGIRMTIGAFLVPVTDSTGWGRSTFSIAAAVFHLCWGFSQPFVVYLAERKLGFGKCIFASSVLYTAGLFIMYASGGSSGLFIFAWGIVIGIAAGGNSFPIVLASIGRRFPQQSKQQAVAFGITSSCGSLGQVIFLPIARSLLTSVSWQMTFVVLGGIMACALPLTYFLQTIPPVPPLPAAKVEKSDLISKTEAVYLDIEDSKVGVGNSPDNGPKSSQNDSEKAAVRASDNEKDDFSAPDIKTALKEAFSSPTFIMICLGFSVCGFHVSFLGTHLPAYLQDHGVSASLAAWTLSIFGAGSVLGSIATGYITNYISPRICLTILYFGRAILFIIFIFIPISTATIMVFTCIFGFLWLSTVPLTTKFIGDVLGQRYLGTLVSVAFVGHQISAFIGAYVGGLVYDTTHTYIHLWYVSLALSVFAVVMNFFAGKEPVNLRRRGLN